MFDRIKNTLLRSTMAVSTDQCLDAVLADRSKVSVRRRAAESPDALPGSLTPITYVLGGAPLAPIGGEFSWNPKTPLESITALAEPSVTEPSLKTRIIDGAVRETRADLAGLMDLAPGTKPANTVKPKSSSFGR